ncbi:MAG: acyl-CoA dehydrogenase family protein, partial [Bdellovibrionota bacterium]
MKKFEAIDFFELDANFSPEQIQIRDSVRSFVDSEIIPNIEEQHRNASFDRGILPKLGELGVLGPQ